MTFGVYSRNESPYWWVWFRDSDKRRFRRTKFSRADPLGYRKCYNYCRSVVADSKQQDKLPSSDFGDWAEDFIKSAPILPSTVNKRMAQWGYVAAYLGSIGVDNPAAVTYANVQGYSSWRLKNRRKVTTRTGLVAIAEGLRLLRMVMREAVARGYIITNPIESMRIKGTQSAIKPEFTTEQENLIITALRHKEGHLPLGARWMTISFAIAIRHGWRLAETSFPLNRIDFNAWTVLVRQKGSRWRTVPVHPELRPMFQQLKADGAIMSCVFPNNSPKFASLAWSCFLRGEPQKGRAGILPTHCFHCCRVTVVSRLARQGIPERLVMEWVGHASSVVHAIYRRISVGDLAQVFAVQSNEKAQSQDGGGTTQRSPLP